MAGSGHVFEYRVAVGEFVEVPVVAEGEQRRKDSRDRPGRRSTSAARNAASSASSKVALIAVRRAVAFVESREFGVVAESVARRVERVQPVPESLGGARPSDARARW